MRAVSATLITAQSAVKRTPYVKLEFFPFTYGAAETYYARAYATSTEGTSYGAEVSFNTLAGGAAIDLSTNSAAYGNRLLLIDHSEEAYNDYATIILKNYDRMIPDLLGYWVEIGYGDVTGGGNEYALTPRLWVKHQQFVSIAGKLLCILELEGSWAKLGETLFRLGTAPYYKAKNINPDLSQGEYDLLDSTPYAIIAAVMAEILPVMTLATLVEDDGIINTFIPDFTINYTQLFENATQIIYNLLKMTKSYLRNKASLIFEVKYPQAADADNLSYYSYQAPYFYEYTEHKNLQVPNRIYVFANRGSDGLWTNILTAQADDTDSQDLYGIVPSIELAPEVTVQADVDNRAAAILRRGKAEVLGGRLLIPHDCQMELYDRLGIYDSRGY
jgi:hypothetical protein